MTAKLSVPFIMMSLLLMGASSTSWVDMEQIDLDFGDNGGEMDAVVRAEDSSVITNVTWTAHKSVSLSVCWNESLAELPLSVTEITLNGTVPGDPDDTGFCAIFVELELDFKLPSHKTTYIVEVQFSDNSSKTWSATFAMTVITTLLDCDESFFTKVSWEDTNTELLNPNCIKEPTQLDLVCYHIGDLSNQELCFTVPNDDDPSDGNITVCLDGPTDYTANITSDEYFSVNFLQYGEANVTPSLSLTTTTRSVDAVIVETDDGQSSVHRCSANTCPLPVQFMPSTSRYQVCGVLKNVQSATTTFYDLQVTIFYTEANNPEMVAPPYLQFVFANVLPNKTYVASLWRQVPQRGDEPLTSEIIDCTEVDDGHGCFGVLATGSLEGEAYLAVENANDGTNQVIVPYHAGIATTAELTSTTEPTTSTDSKTTTSAATTTVPDTGLLGSQKRRNSRNELSN